MQEKKQVVDKYLIENYENILKLKEQKNFKWFDVAFDIAVKSNYSDFSTKDGRLLLDSEYVRNRWRKLVSKIEPKLPIAKERPKSSTLDVKFQYLSGKEDKSKGTSEFQFTASHIPSEAEIIEHFKVDTTKFTVNQIYHKTSFGGKYSVTVSLLAKKGNQVITIDEDFLEKLNSISPLKSEELEIVSKHFKASEKPKACLLIPKQDVHWNKHDINGNNSIEDRFVTFTKTILNQLEKAQATNNIEKIIYIVGSDEFNSEWTGGTTKGTPQKDILSYQESFEKVSDFTIEFTKLLRFYAPTVEIVLLNGNHDHNVSWHLANLLKHVFSKNESILVNTELVNTKILEYASNLILINHGDEMKPKDLASKFPIIAKDKWSNFDNYFVVTGDKHHEVAHDFNGVMTYQVPQLSTAKSSWDDKRGHVCSKAESIMFLFEEDGLSNILRKQIK